MTSDPVTTRIRWQRAREIFDAIVDANPDEQRARLDEACGGDAALRREVESLLGCDRSSHGTIERVVAQAASDADIAAPAAVERLPIPTVIGRYRILGQIAEGGMAEVFLAEDTSLGRRVALKLPGARFAARGAARLRLLQEARAAATISHPHVCVVHEVGEGPGGRPFIAMEYAEGETLAARISRGRLPHDEVWVLAEQAAGALHIAHANGIVHRDLKPANIMLTRHGAKLLDFGLASMTVSSLSDQSAATGVFAGTIPYMSPEQIRGEEIDARTDIYSLGVVLYEATTGRRPFEGRTPQETCDAILDAAPRPLRQLAPDLPAPLGALIRRAMAPDRERRYQSAAALAADAARASRPPERARGRGRTMVLALALAAVTVIAALVYGLRSRSPAQPTLPGNALLLAGFTNSTRDPAFDGTLDEALAAQLQQTPHFTLFPDAGRRETLRAMSRSPAEDMTPDLALAICRRRGIRAWIAGRIAPVGRGYDIALEAFDGRTGAPLAREHADAQARIDVLPALGAAATRLRARLGEPSASLRRFSAPVERATTGSLEALSAYALAAARARQGDYGTAVSLYERALQIDPQFATAWAALARDALNSGFGQDVVTAAAARAYELRERGSEQEKLRIGAFYHATVTGNLEAAIAAGEKWKNAYPHDWEPYHVLADLYLSTARYEPAVLVAREAVRRNPDVAAAYSNLAGSLFAQDRFDDARAVYRAAIDRGLDAPEYHAFLWRIAYYGGDGDGMQQQMDWAAASSTWTSNMPALAAALQGRWHEAQRLSERATEFFGARNLHGFAALAARYDAVSGALVGDCATSRRRARLALGPSSAIEDQARVAVALAYCGDRAAAQDFASRVRHERPEDTMLNLVWLPLVAAAAAIDAAPPRAVEALRATAPYEGAAESWPVYMRGLALLRAGRGTEAATEFRKIIENRGRTFWVPFYPLAHLGAARAAAMSGDATAARSLYERLFDLWKEADADLPVLAEARREYARLPAR